MENRTKRVAAIHDLSCFGRCALTVIMPILSVMGIQVCPLPTALLSTHTGGFKDFSFTDLTPEIEKISSHWKELGIKFDGIYTGFLGSAEQIERVERFIFDFGKGETLTVIDPVMGDNGHLYSTYTKEMVEGVRGLISHADVLTPNMTEACILTNRKYAPYREEQEIKDILLELSEKGPRKVIITGINSENIAAVIGYDRSENAFYRVENPLIDRHYPGTGDVYASIITGSLVSGENMQTAMGRASYFNFEVIKETYELNTTPREGVEIERKLPLLLSPDSIFESTELI